MVLRLEQIEHLSQKKLRMCVLEPPSDFSRQDRLKCGANVGDDLWNGARCLTAHQSFELGEQQLNRIEIWAVRREIQQRTAPSLDECPNRREVMRRQVVQDHHLSCHQDRTQLLTDVPLEDLTVERPVNDQRGQWPRQAQRTDQTLILSMIAGRGADRPEMSGRAGIPARHVGLEAALVEKDQPFWTGQIRFKIVQKSGALILTAFECDQCFFYG